MLFPNKFEQWAVDDARETINVEQYDGNITNSSRNQKSTFQSKNRKLQSKIPVFSRALSWDLLHYVDSKLEEP